MGSSRERFYDEFREAEAIARENHEKKLAAKQLKWDEYFMGFAEHASTRATCDRKHVGAVIVKDRTVIATGYNGSVAGLPHCDDAGHDLKDGHCVAGDTVLSKFQGGHYNAKHRTVSEVYEMWNSRWSLLARKLQLRSADENGLIVPDSIVDIWKNEPKQLYKLYTFLGRSVRATSDHLFLTPNGWKALGELSVGDKVALNGVPLYKNSKWLKKKYAEQGLTQVQLAALCGCGRSTIRRHLVKHGITVRQFELGGWNSGMSRHLSMSYKDDEVSASVARSRARRYALSESCAVCEEVEKLQVHHIDRNVYNDSPDNLVTLCVKCHNLAHTCHAKRECVVYDAITDIKKDAIEPVFDLTMAKHHNFVGNGFILHNCVRTIHAEVNAILQAARNGVCVEGAEIYINTFPCWNCFKAIANTGIKRIVYKDLYRPDPRIVEALSLLKIEVVELKNVTE